MSKVKQKSFDEVERGIFENWLYNYDENSTLIQAISSGEFDEELAKLGYVKLNQIRRENEK